MDLTTGWDFRRKEDRDKAERYLDEYQPYLLVGSPMCQMFSQLQRMSGWSQEKQERWCEAVEHIRFVVSLIRSTTTGSKASIEAIPYTVAEA